MERKYNERVELVCHTGYSKNMGICSPREMVKYAKDNGMTSVGIADFGSMGGIPEFSICAEEIGISTIYGCEFFIQVDSGNSIKLVTLAKDGMATINKLFSTSEEKYRYQDIDNVVIPSDEPFIGNECYSALKGVYAYDFDRYDSVHFVMLTPNMGEELVRRVIKKAKSDKFLIYPVAVSAPYYTSTDKKTAYDILLSLNDNKYEEREDAHFMTTEEMLNHFSYLGEDLAYEIVVENSNIIAEKCVIEKPIDNFAYVPGIKNGSKYIKDICESELTKKYEIVSQEIRERLDWELDTIINGGNEYLFLNLYWVIKEIDLHPFEFGNRGCVAGSLVAYLMDITCIDPIRYNIPPYFLFALKGDKVPDIDLNLRSQNIWKLFVSEYSRLSNVERVVLPGCYRTYTEAEAAEDVEYCIKKNHLHMDKAIKENVVNCLKNTVLAKGRHPGGILVVPKNIDVECKMPLYNLQNSDQPLMVSEYNYHSIDHLFTKVDLLLHSTPEVLYRLWQLTGVNPMSVDHDDADVMNMFKFDEEGKLKCIGLPECANEDVIEMLSICEPKNMCELATLFGYLHGTGVWESAKNIIESGIASISDVPGCREDVFNYFVAMGIDSEEAYKFTELIRKGKIAYSKEGKRTYAEEIRNKWNDFRNKCLEKNIPEWYLNHLESIKYMFPKAHALSYMVQVWQVAWFKLHYPMEYYKVMIDVKFDFVDFSLLEQGLEKIKEYYENIPEYEEDIFYNPYRHGVYNFLKQLYVEGYDCIYEKSDEQGLCQIDRTNNRFIITR